MTSTPRLCAARRDATAERGTSRAAQDQGIEPEALEIGFGDEARIGQTNKITRRWARRGGRPVAPQERRTASTCIFGAVCPQQGKGAAFVLPQCNTEAMSLHLAEIATMVGPGRHAALLVDPAAWHHWAALNVPSNVTLLPLPPKCPELTVMENVWQFMCDNWLSNRVFAACDDIVVHCCEAWNRPIDAYNFARRLKNLKGLTPYEFVCKAWAEQRGRFTLNAHHQVPGLNN